ncbi:MAG: 50S ribosomal protein L28 [Bdellovibrionales bacterium]|nr:50S ribosomal protein L28 [Bdellovibrionales bacterium]
MARCELTGKGPSVKNLVSHSNIKTKSIVHANIQKKQLHSQALNEFVDLKIATSTLRAIENRGSFDSYLLNLPEENLSKRAMTFKTRVKRKLAGKTKKKAAKE